MHYLLHFGIHENAFTITPNAIILQLLGASPPQTPQRGLCPLHPGWGHSPRPHSPPPQHDLVDPPLVHISI